MKITDVRFVKSCFSLKDLPRPVLPEIAFAGRSNVGKSSLINTILNRRGIAKTSSTPGRTQSINFIRVNTSLYFVDLPGYGYAKVPKQVQGRWRELIEGYLQNRPVLRLMLLLVDPRREPTEDETLFVGWLEQHRIPYMVVMTKADKVKRNAGNRAARLWQQHLGLDTVYVFSSVTGEGKQQVMSKIIAALSSSPDSQLD